MNNAFGSSVRSLFTRHSVVVNRSRRIVRRRRQRSSITQAARSTAPAGAGSKWDGAGTASSATTAAAATAATSSLLLLLFLEYNVNNSDGEDDEHTTTSRRPGDHDGSKRWYSPSFLVSSLFSSQPNICQTEKASAEKEKEEGKEEDRPFMLFLGTGSSTGCPKPLCTMTYASSKRYSSHPPPTALTPKMCRVSNLAILGDDPRQNKDYRNNPSFLIHHYDPKTKSYKNIVIDTGKTFRETALRWFPRFGIQSLDALILTHHHMDAAGGLDDVRGFQSILSTSTGGGEGNVKGVGKVKDGPPKRVPIPIYMSPFCHENLKRQFPWLFPTPGIRMPVQHDHLPHYFHHKADYHCCCRSEDFQPESREQKQLGDGGRHSPSMAQNVKVVAGSTPSAPATQTQASTSAAATTAAEPAGGQAPTVKRDVASFDVTLFEDLTEYTIPSAGDFKFTPLPIWHGDDLMSHGFAFSLMPPEEQRHDHHQHRQGKPMNVVYLSDISRMVPKTLEYIKNHLPPTDILIIDSLLWHKTHPVHYSLDQAVELATKHIRPTHATYLIGMSCDNFLPHNEMNKHLEETYGGNITTGTENNGENYRPIIRFAYDGQPLYLPTLSSSGKEDGQS